MIDEISLLRLLNVIISVLSVPPSIFLFREVSIEKTDIHPESRFINNILRRLFFLFAIGSIASATLSLLLFLGFEFDQSFLPQSVFNLRNLIINTMISITSWGFWIIVLHQKKGKNE